MPPVDKNAEEGAVELSAETTSTSNSTSNSKKGKKNSTTTGNKNNSNNKDDIEASADDALSEEDRELKERLETCASTVLNVDREESVTVPIRLVALEMIVTELRSATASMTSVPKPLKFLRPRFADLRTLWEELRSSPTTTDDKDTLLLRARLSDVLAVAAMTVRSAGTTATTTTTTSTKTPTATTSTSTPPDVVVDPEDPRESLRYKLAAIEDYRVLKKDHDYVPPGSEEDNGLGSWGHEFVRNLAGEIGREYNARMLDETNQDGPEGPNCDDLMAMVDVIVPFHLSHNAEAEAIDLLIEVQNLKKLLEVNSIDARNYRRICSYLLATADYQSDPDDLAEMLETTYELYVAQGQPFDALRVALRMSDESKIPKLFASTEDVATKKQMCLLLGRHRVYYEVEDDGEDPNVDTYNELIGNTTLSEHFVKLSQDLDVADAKTPEDIYKSHLAETGGVRRRREAPTVDSARANLASTFVNAFVNAGACHDSLMTPDSEWLYKNRDHGMMSATASLGLILLWNVDEGLSQIDKYLYSNEDHIRAGAALAVGILSSGVRNDADPALALLTEHLQPGGPLVVAASTGLGIAYAGSGREEVMEPLLRIVEGEDDDDNGGDDDKESSNANMVEVGTAALALGMICVSQCDDSVGGALVQRIMEASETELDHPHAKFLVLGLGLLFLGRGEKVDAILEALKTVDHAIVSFAVVLVEACAYAGTGNVLVVQEMLHRCAEHHEEGEALADEQAAAVLGIGAIALGEPVGAEMALRAMDHLLHYGELPIKRSVPLALAILHISAPDYAVVDQLSRLSHDPDPSLSRNAILGLGLVGAGTNHSKIAGLLRQLSDFYRAEAGHMFCVRIAQALLHLGKGLLTLGPLHSDRKLMCGPALGSLMIILTCCLDLKHTLLDVHHYLLYYLTCGMNPRMLITTDEEGTWKPVTVRVGQAVETVGQAGVRPRTITGFQTHTTPVLIGARERAEFANEEFLPAAASVLEGIVLIKENPDYDPEEK